MEMKMECPKSETNWGQITPKYYVTDTDKAKHIKILIME